MTQAYRRDATSFWAVSLLLAISAMAQAESRPASTMDLIDGIVAKSEAIFSMKLDYTYQGVAKDLEGGILTQDERHLQVTILGHDWIVRDAGHPHFTMRRNQANFCYTESSAPAGRLDRSLQITAPETYSSLIAAHAAHAGPRLGSFWFHEQTEFIDKHREHAERLKPQTIDGRISEVLQWKINATTFGQAMLVIPPQIANAKQGWLRVYVAPSLHHALPRIEYVAPSGKVEMRIDSSDFRTVAPDVSFPFYVTCTSDYLGGQDQSEYRVITADYINEELPDEEFAMQIPPGTRVRDSRPGVPTSVFSLTGDEQSSVLQDAMSDSSAKGRPKTKSFLMIANIALLFLTALVWGYSKWRSNLTS